jgi:hypothetical protein
MEPFETTFEKLLGRAPTKTERENLYRIRDALGIRDNDALWIVLMALEIYGVKYAAIPLEIEQMIRRILNDLRQGAYELAEFSVQMTKADLSQAVADTARGVAKAASRNRDLQWMGAGISISAIALCVSGWLSYQAGHEAGLGQGYQEARSERAAAAWGNSMDGRLAFRMSQAGSLQQLARCSQPGWQVLKGACFARPASDGMLYGWKIP